MHSWEGKGVSVPAQRRPMMRVPDMEVFTTGITSANSASKALQTKRTQKTKLIRTHHIESTPHPLIHQTSNLKLK